MEEKELIEVLENAKRFEESVWNRIDELASAVQGLLNEQLKARTSVQEVVQVNADSLTVGTPGAGQIKVFGDFGNKEAFRRKLDSALELEKYLSGKKNGQKPAPLTCARCGDESQVLIGEPGLCARCARQLIENQGGGSHAVR
jgi:hypothetical protein